MTPEIPIDASMLKNLIKVTMEVFNIKNILSKTLQIFLTCQERSSGDNSKHYCTLDNIWYRHVKYFRSHDVSDIGIKKKNLKHFRIADTTLFFYGYTYHNIF